MATSHQEQQTSATFGPLSAIFSTVLPDLNDETYPFGEVQELLGHFATLNMFSAPIPRETSAEIGYSGYVIGFQALQTLQALDIHGGPAADGFRVSNSAGAPVGKCAIRWMIIPDDYHALPGVEPPATPFDPSRSQRFVMPETTFEFNQGRDGFWGFGTGTTHPGPREGKGIPVTAVGYISKGYGAFSGLEGLYVFNGALSPSRGFEGSIVCRFPDFSGRLVTSGPAPVTPGSPPDPEYSYFCLQYSKETLPGTMERAPSAFVSYAFSAAGLPVGAFSNNTIDRIWTGFSTEEGPAAVQAETRVGETIGNMVSTVIFAVLRAAGPPDTPALYRASNTISIFDQRGEALGSFRFDVSEGRSFYLEFPGLPGQQGNTFAGTGPIGHGTGVFEGIQGVGTDNSAIGVQPFATVGFTLGRIFDPDGRYRAFLGGDGSHR